MKFEAHRTTLRTGARPAEGAIDLAPAVSVDEGVGVLRPTDALSRRPGASLGGRVRLRARSRTFVQPMGATVDSSRARRG